MGGLWSPYVLGLVGSIAVVAAVASLAWRHRHRTGGTELAVFLLVILSWAAVYCVALVTHDPAMRRLLERIMYLSVATVPVAWLVFTLVYTGRYNGFTRSMAIGLLVVALAICAVALTNNLHHWLWQETEVVITDGIAVVQHTSGPLHRPIQAFVYGIVILGSAVIIRESIGSNGLYHDQTAVLLVGTGAPVVASIYSNLGYGPIEGLSMTPYAFTVSGLAFGYAVMRIDLLEVLPATRTVGRDMAIEQLAECVLIVDARGQIVDANRAAASVIKRHPGALVGVDIRSVLNADPSTDIESLPTEVGIDGRLLELTASPIHDGTDAPIGHTVVLRDVTDERLRKTQLEVLNRVLRHNLRNKLAIIQGHADVLADRHDLADTEALTAVSQAIDELTALSDRSREFERLKVLESLDTAGTDVGEVVRTTVDDLTCSHPAATVTIEASGELVVQTHREVLAIAIENLLHNAIVHNDNAHPRVTVTAEETSTGVSVAIADDGPGIPPSELEVLTSGRETAINHGSGLGLWVTKWAVQYLRGDISFERRQPRGTIARLSVPTIDDGGSTRRHVGTVEAPSVDGGDSTGT